MSHHVEVKTSFTNAKALQTALERMFGVGQVKVAENVFVPSLPLKGWGGSPLRAKGSFCVPGSVRGHSYDFALSYEGGSFTVQKDSMDRIDMEELTVQYEFAALEQEYSLSFPEASLQQVRLPNGDMQIVVEGLS